VCCAFGGRFAIATKLTFWYLKAMASSRLSGTKKRMGRPPVGSTSINVRLPPAELAALDAWIVKQDDPQPSRPEAIRRHLTRGLAAEHAPAKPRRMAKKGNT
jgi:hypothetical protein